MLSFVCRTRRSSATHALSGYLRSFITRLAARGSAVKRRDWLLLFAAYQGAPDGLDPVRFQKGMFLFSRRRGVPKRSTYDFKPHAYGPMSVAQAEARATAILGAPVRAIVSPFPETGVNVDRVSDIALAEELVRAARPA